MKLLLFSFIAFLLASVPTCKVKDVSSMSAPISHELWTKALTKHVDDQGWVDYTAWAKDTTDLVQYLTLVSANHPNDENWTKDEQLAYWINAYNAFTIKIMLDYWPQKSIKEIKGGVGFINSIWDEEFFQIEGQAYDLNDLEHGIIRPKFEDARIHMAVNCASISCPALRNEAYTAKRLNAQLDEQCVKAFQSFRNDLTDLNMPKVSKIFSWYGDDFKWKNSSLTAFIEKYAKVDLPEGAKIQYKDYNWQANSIENKNLSSKE